MCYTQHDEAVWPWVYKLTWLYAIQKTTGKVGTSCAEYKTTQRTSAVFPWSKLAEI